ncbi:hypothetical protein PMU66_02680 [Enterococcus durans]|uniref:Uncharacterized protein n=1 Tax=Enterococcus durans TaxID=53345 RepID=A0A367CEY8_9ENTE|nr:hypothetical protein [Enterococcus durans]MBE8847895.1 hypothetical protein [Enterococcus durans]MDB1652580.1 hypothetical protein [Enterococcus durans]MDB1656172.1 hypothetical protein [Enterococcus durans]MDB1663006.1 hypothetical protein [Enterococcus durans]MDB1668150.1 hypothetical protein [Enterococcus durans]
MATKKTYTAEITCDVCKKKEIIHEGEPQSIFSVESAVRETGSLNERGQFIKSKEQPLLIENLDLCIDCREKSYAMIIARITQPYTTTVIYSFLSNKEQGEAE